MGLSLSPLLVTNREVIEYVSTTIRIDDDMILLFKKLATETKIGYQTLINTALREYSRKIRKKAVKAG